MHLNIMDARAHAISHPSSPSSSGGESPDMSRRGSFPLAFRNHPLFGKLGIFSWRIVGGIFASLLVVGWVFIVIVLIKEEKWQLVLVAWLLLYAAAHFCYWYFKRHNLVSFQSQICRRVRTSTHSTSVRPLEKPMDAPPSYDDVIKSEHPPPTYCSVVVEPPPRSSQVNQTNKKFGIFFALENLPTVFGRESSGPSPSRKTQIPSYSPTISAAVSSNTPYRWDTPERGSPPSYDQSCTVDVESQTILDRPRTSRSSSSLANYNRPRTSRSILRVDSLSSTSDGSLTPILSPILSNATASNSRAQQTTTNGETVAGTSFSPTTNIRTYEGTEEGIKQSGMEISDSLVAN